MLAKDFESLYESARERNPELASLSPSDLQILIEQHKKYLARDRTSNFLFSATTLPIVYVMVLVCSNAALRLAEAAAARLSLFDYSSFIERFAGLKEGLLIGSFMVIAYFILLPVAAKFISSPPFNVFEVSVNRGFVVTAIIAIYIASAWAILSYDAYFHPRTSLLRGAFFWWLAPLATILSIAPLGLSFIGAILLRRAKSRKPTSEIQVLGSLLTILKDWPETTPTVPLSADIKRKIAWQIHTASGTIRRLHFTAKPNDAAEEWAMNQMKLAADNLLVCISWLYVSQVGTFENVRMRVVAFTNSFLGGRLHELPRGELSEDQGLKRPARKQRLMRTVSAAIAVLAYCLIPVVFYFIFRQRVGPVNIPESLLLLLYSLWIVAGLYAYLEQTSQNAGATIVELVKSILGR